MAHKTFMMKGWMKDWPLSSAILALGSVLSGSVSTLILDPLVKRPAPASLTTLLPGFVYASATVMKVCLVTGLAIAVLTLIFRTWSSNPSQDQRAEKSFEQGVPVLGFTSIALAMSTPLAGAIAVVTAQELAYESAGPTLDEFSYVSRAAVFVMLFQLLAGGAVALTSLVRRERSLLAPAIGFIVNGLLFGLFCYLKFYALGFDQDKWAVGLSHAIFAGT
jgi:hypothetical protein